MSQHDQIDDNDLVVEALWEYQSRLEGHSASSETAETLDTAPLDVPLELQERVERGKACLDLLMAYQRVSLLGGSRGLRNGESLERQEAAAMPRRIGRFEVLGELGSGGFGLVYRARDPLTDRHVALKIPRLEALASRELRERFEQEARAAAKLDHPAIVPVLEAGADGVLPYIASAYYPAITLAQWLKSRRQLVRPGLAAELIRQIAEAVAHAHRRGVLHRDIKPSNVLLVPRLTEPLAQDDLGALGLEAFEPKLMDFGLAKLTAEARDMTRTGSLLGTVRYMPPEQAAGRTREIGPASDVYSLGVILYELLCGSPPFSGNADLEVLRKIETVEPSRIRAVHPHVPVDLETICLTCLEKQPARRYASAQALADDLECFLKGRPIGARPVTRLERTAKWCRRNPAWAALLAVSGLAIVTIIVGLTWSNVRTARERDRALEYAYGTDIRWAQEAWENGAVGEVRRILNQHIPRRGARDFRGIEWHLLADAAARHSRVVAQQPATVWSLGISHDNLRFATGDTQGVVRLWQLQPPKLLRELQGHAAGHIDAVLFTPDGRRLISAGDDHTIRFWNSQSGREELVLREHRDWVGALAVSRDGKYLASGGAEGRVLLWDLEGAKLIRQLHQLKGAIRWVIFHPQEPWLASASESGDVRLWNYLDNCAPPHVEGGIMQSPGEDVSWRGATFSPDGGALAAANKNEMVVWQVLHVENGSRIRERGRAPSKIMSLAISPRWDLEGGDEIPEIRLRSNTRRGAPVRRLTGHTDAVRCLAFLADGDTFLSGSEDGTVREWQPSVALASDLQKLPLGAANARLLWWPRRHALVAAEPDGAIKYIDVEPKLSQKLIGHAALGTSQIVCAGDGESFATISQEGLLEWWQVGRGRTASFSIKPGISAAALCNADRQLAFALGKSLHVVEAQTGRPLWQVEHPLEIHAIQPVGSELLTASDEVVRRFDALSGRLLRQAPAEPHWPRLLATSQGGHRYVTLSGDHTLRVYDTQQMRQTAMLTMPTEGRAMHFIDEDRRFLVYDDSSVSIVNLRTSQELLRLDVPWAGLAKSCSDDGRWLAALDGNWLLVAPLDIE